MDDINSIKNIDSHNIIMVAKYYKKFICIFFVMLSSILIGACSSSAKEDLNRYIFQVENRPPRPIEPMPKLVHLQNFVFPENDNRRSPFRPVSKSQSDEYAPNVTRPKQPLEAYPLDALKFVGTVTENGKIWALIGQPGNLISRATYGDYMGQNFGKIVKIDNKTLEVEETIKLEGKWVRKLTKISLRVPGSK